jgi:hypothetical protein
MFIYYANPANLRDEIFAIQPKVGQALGYRDADSGDFVAFSE